MSEEMRIRDTRTFITVISEQGQNEFGDSYLEEFIYDAPENSNLKYNKKISFPITAALNAYTQQGDKVRIIAIYSDNNDNMNNNLVSFYEEIRALMQEKGIKETEDYVVEEVKVDSFVGRDSDLELYEKLLDKINEGEILHICITYGIKAMPIILFDVAQYAWKAKDNDIECIIYGHVDRMNREHKGAIYDMTSLFYKHEILLRHVEMGDENPIDSIRVKEINENDDMDE